jgi:hypothetical protein
MLSISVVSIQSIKPGWEYLFLLITHSANFIMIHSWKLPRLLLLERKVFFRFTKPCIYRICRFWTFGLSAHRNFVWPWCRVNSNIHFSLVFWSDSDSNACSNPCRYEGSGEQLFEMVNDIRGRLHCFSGQNCAGGRWEFLQPPYS